MGTKKPKGSPPSLPPNLFDTKPSNIEENADSWFEDISRWAVEIEHGTKEEPESEEDRQKPLYLLAAEELARAQQTTPEVILEQYADRLRQSSYPTPDCLTPDEVLTYSDSGIEPRPEHTEQCQACAALLSATNVSERRLGEFFNELRSRRAALQPEQGQPSSPWYQRATKRSFWRAVVASLILPVLVVAVLLNLHSEIPVTSIAVLPMKEDLSSSRNMSLGYLQTSGIVSQAKSSSPVPEDGTRVLGYEMKDVLGYGMADVLVSTLGTITQMRVISLDSSKDFASSDKSMSEIAQALKVDAVVQGVLQRDGDRLIVSTSLFDARTNKDLGTDRRERTLGDALSLRNQLVKAIVARAGVTLTADEATRLDQDVAEDPKALELYFDGRYRLSKRQPDLIEAAKVSFAEAIKISEGFGLAYVGLADCYNLSILRSIHGAKVEEARKAYEEAIKNAERAKSLDPTLAGANSAVALSKMWYEHDWKGAGEEFERARTKNPNHVPTRHWYGIYLGYLKRSSEAISELTRAIELNPRSSVILGALADVNYLAGDYEKAISQYQEALKLASERGENPTSLKINLATAYLHKRDFDKAIAEFKNFPEAKPSVAQAYALSGDKERARQILNDIERSGQAREYSSVAIAVAYGALGEKDQAFRYLLKEAFPKRDPGLLQLKVAPDFNPLRSDPRFNDLLRQMNFLESV